jgi:hypothetical protein
MKLSKLSRSSKGRSHNGKNSGIGLVRTPGARNSLEVGKKK